ncbi:hypothetical protein P9160_07565 [Bacillus halotolerans]|uniref:hypothetical protein n=1 Tax=Bacillus halotolerans TaxID=260554 RepID=UPI001F078E8A|nr:hypothetical protein [Bacillus halotolerans]MEC3757228.1 hypothetical protein [Bacillus halotolerans]
MLKAVVSLLAILLSAPRIEKEIQLWNSLTGGKSSWITLSSLFMVSQSHRGGRLDQYEMGRCICEIQRNQSTLSSM